MEIFNGGGMNNLNTKGIKSNARVGRQPVGNQTWGQKGKNSNTSTAALSPIQLPVALISNLYFFFLIHCEINM